MSCQLPNERFLRPGWSCLENKGSDWERKKRKRRTKDASRAEKDASRAEKDASRAYKRRVAGKRQSRLIQKKWTRRRLNVTSRRKTTRTRRTHQQGVSQARTHRKRAVRHPTNTKGVRTRSLYLKYHTLNTYFQTNFSNNHT